MCCRLISIKNKPSHIHLSEVAFGVTFYFGGVVMQCQPKTIPGTHGQDPCARVRVPGYNISSEYTEEKRLTKRNEQI